MAREPNTPGAGRRSRWWWLLRAPAYLLLSAALGAGYVAATPMGIRPAGDPVATASAPTRSVVPAVGQRLDGDGAFRLTATSAISAIGDTLPVARYLQTMLRDLTGFEFPISRRGDIALVLAEGPPENGYQLEVRPAGIRLAANDTDALFWGVQSLRQLLPLDLDTKGVRAVASTLITDSPRFAYRGAMLDVARHFFDVDEVKRYIDALVMVKINVLHLHLSDDQGWRLAIDGWPRLTSHGGSTQVGGGPGGYYTQDDYRDIVAYAAFRHMTIVPEIDMPGHTNAALSSYPALNCDGETPPLYTGMSVGFSSLCVNKAVTYRFLEDVLNQLAALTPGPWVHLGGDESSATGAADYATFVNRASAIVAAEGKTVIGWHDIGWASKLPAGSIGEYWDYTTPRGASPTLARRIIANGGALVMAPSNVAYLDMQYTVGGRPGTNWAGGPTTIRQAYDWDPARIIPGVADESILGVEAPLWSETFSTLSQLEYMAFPRVVAIAEIGWSRATDRTFEEFAPRLGAFGPYLEDAGVTFNRTPGVPWR